jgi:RND family efflux transporter MFP subunit
LSAKDSDNPPKSEETTSDAEEPEKAQQEVDTPKTTQNERSNHSNQWRMFLSSLGKTVGTLAILAIMFLAAVVIWNFYVSAPWTRDGRVRVQVASIAPQVSGQITEVHVVDNQFVHKGDVLYVIDPFDFRTSLDSARAQQLMRAADLQVKKNQSERRQKLSDLATTPEEQQVYAGNEAQARAAFQGAQAQVAQAEINLARTKVTSPVNGYVTNLLMRVGDYSQAGNVNISVIDSDSYWIDGYFEETKMSHVCIGDRAEAQLLGYRDPIVGHVQTVTRGISVSNATSSTQGLPSVDPIYTWVRLAQRVPVRIAISDVPPGVPLVSGMTATITLKKGDGTDTMSARFSHAWSAVADLFYAPTPSPDCVPVISKTGGTVTTLPTAEPSPPQSPAQLDPGLAPGKKQSPKTQ